MKAGVCLFIDSFSLEEEQIKIFNQIKDLKALVERVDSDFIKFLRSNEFDGKFVTKLFSTNPDYGGLVNEYYKIGQISLLDEIGCNELLNIINTSPSILAERKLCAYQSPDIPLKKDNTVSSESEIIDLSKKILDEFPADCDEYADNIKNIFKNVIFLDNPPQSFNFIRRIEGGYENFLKSITEFLYFVNNYTIIPNDSQHNIRIMNSSLPYLVTPEGGGKNKRAIGELKRDFKVGDCIYKDVNCEFHYKLEYMDNTNRKGTYYYNRIYFGFFNRIPDRPAQIAIAHIGDHL
ncbi:hypothetical protein L420_01695 [Enterobacter hormaechei subsp. hoffmannii UCICRE 9]|uniref:hypothetical protein n=2 Tax=Gammaproteobacteria TaxID=1236 RepID=UPI0002C991B8|nr:MULTISPECIES: hypothetical protein [Enterobacterales]EBN3334019.1 hypothetical protein [Salmonella enterica]ECM3182478.1 hypothetical protein [Salmonella enterica subsp. enterica serovar Newport]CCP01508.1 hypothetical protein BN439_0418 [Erwinia amylovora Ea644]CCP05502.1 hypothetical protein BN440_0450 [Erwinia amylovora MR1]HAV7676467.1 hypothetical protein [Escherichia coli]